MPVIDRSDSRLFFQPDSAASKLDKYWAGCWARYEDPIIKGDTAVLAEHLGTQPNAGAQVSTDVTVALVYGILTTGGEVSTRCTDYLGQYSRDKHHFSVDVIRKLVQAHYPQLHSAILPPLLALFREMVQWGAIGAEALGLALLRQIAVGDLSEANVWLACTVVHTIRGQMQWLLQCSPLVVHATIYKYLRLLPDASRGTKGPEQALTKSATGLCLQLLTEHWEICTGMGRDLVRALQDVSRINEFRPLWRDLQAGRRPGASTEDGVDRVGTPGDALAAVLTVRTPSPLLQSALTPDMEKELYFMMTQVRMGNQRRYQGWFQARYLSTPESESLIPDLVRFICGVYHPTNQIIASDITPRWAVIGWLLQLARAQPQVANSKLALFYDLLLFQPQSDSIMNIEPAMLLMTRSIPKYPAITNTLLEFVVLAKDHYNPPRRSITQRGFAKGMTALVQRGVVRSLDILVKAEELSYDLRSYLANSFKQFCSGVPPGLGSHVAEGQPPSASKRPLEDPHESPVPKKVASIHTADLQVDYQAADGQSPGLSPRPRSASGHLPGGDGNPATSPRVRTPMKRMSEDGDAPAAQQEQRGTPVRPPSGPQARPSDPDNANSSPATPERRASTDAQPRTRIPVGGIATYSPGPRQGSAGPESAPPKLRSAIEAAVVRFHEEVVEAVEEFRDTDGDTVSMDAELIPLVNALVQAMVTDGVGVAIGDAPRAALSSAVDTVLDCMDMCASAGWEVFDHSNVAVKNSNRGESTSTSLRPASDSCLGGALLLSCCSAIAEGSPGDQRAAVELVAALRTQLTADEGDPDRPQRDYLAELGPALLCQAIDEERRQGSGVEGAASASASRSEVPAALKGNGQGGGGSRLYVEVAKSMQPAEPQGHHVLGRDLRWCLGKGPSAVADMLPLLLSSRDLSSLAAGNTDVIEIVAAVLLPPSLLHLSAGLACGSSWLFFPPMAGSSEALNACVGVIAASLSWDSHSQGVLWQVLAAEARRRGPEGVEELILRVLRDVQRRIVAPLEKEEPGPSPSTSHVDSASELSSGLLGLLQQLPPSHRILDQLLQMPASFSELLRAVVACWVSPGWPGAAAADERLSSLLAASAAAVRGNGPGIQTTVADLWGVEPPDNAGAKQNAGKGSSSSTGPSSSTSLDGNKATVPNGGSWKPSRKGMAQRLGSGSPSPRQELKEGSASSESD